VTFTAGSKMLPEMGMRKKNPCRKAGTNDIPVEEAFGRFTFTWNKID